MLLDNNCDQYQKMFGMIVLAIDISDTFIGQDGYGFLQLTNQQRGILIGIPSMILFFISFGIGYSQKSRIATSLPSIGLLLSLSIGQTSLYIALIGISCIIGVFRAARRR
jgi:putative Mn2+ efflux pump MntP